MRPLVCLHTSYYAWKACPEVGRSFRLLGEAGTIHPKRLLAFHPPKVRTQLNFCLQLSSFSYNDNIDLDFSRMVYDDEHFWLLSPCRYESLENMHRTKFRALSALLICFQVFMYIDDFVLHQFSLSLSVYDLDSIKA